jgi:hypothetical protein
VFSAKNNFRTCAWSVMVPSLVAAKNPLHMAVVLPRLPYHSLAFRFLSPHLIRSRFLFVFLLSVSAASTETSSATINSTTTLMTVRFHSELGWRKSERLFFFFLAFVPFRIMFT